MLSVFQLTDSVNVTNFFSPFRVVKCGVDVELNVQKRIYVR